MQGAVLTPLALMGCGGGSSNVGGGGGGTRSASAQWTATLLDAISATRLGPPMNARAIALVATAAYDAWACYDAVALGTRLGSQLRRPAAERTIGNKQQAISFAAYRVLVELYPTQKARFDAKMAELGYDINDMTTDATRPQGIGNRVAQALMEFRRDDGSNQRNDYVDTTGYVPVNTPDNVVDPSKWQPLRFANGATPAYIGPHWGNVIPFGLTSPSVFRPPAPPAYGTPTYREQAKEVVDLLANLDDRKKTIAEYWADGPSTVQPPGHWQLFGLNISERRNHSLDDDIKMFFALGNAVMDAGIACWECKRFYNTSRPFTAIRALYAGQNIAAFVPGTGIVMRDGAQWHPYQPGNFITPPFPEYTSGHSTFSAAAAEILKRFTGSDSFGLSVTIPARSSVIEPNVPSQPITLDWDTFTQAADEAGVSRLYGGIHFLAGDLEARRCGRLVGQAVWERAQSFINGTAPSRVPIA
jgi:hypothetical protein